MSTLWAAAVAALVASSIAACGSDAHAPAADGGVDASALVDAGPGEETMPGCYVYPEDGTCAAPLVHRVCLMVVGPKCDTDGALYPNGAIGYCCP